MMIKKSNKNAPVRLNPAQSTCRDGPQLVERASEAGDVGGGWHDRPQVELIQAGDVG